MTEAARDKLVAYSWPGNIRELENVIERCLLFAEGTEIGESDLPAEIRVGAEAPRSENVGETGLKEQVREAAVKIERDLIQRALGQTGGNVTRAARLLKISRKSLQNKMKELGLREDVK